MRERDLCVGDLVDLRMLEEEGPHEGGLVTYFRVFSPDAARSAGIDVRGYSDLDAPRILHAGHTRRDCVVVLDGGMTLGRDRQHFEREQLDQHQFLKEATR